MKKSDINPLPEYFDRYINLVDDVELPQAFDLSVQRLNALDESLLTNLGDKKYAPDKWTVKEIFQHLIDWERILSQRALLFARIPNSTAQSVDENQLAAKMNAERRMVGALIDELKIVRASTAAMFESFEDEMLNNTGTNWKSKMSVLATGFTIVGHQIHHFRIIEEKYLPLVDVQSQGFANATNW